jgi:hypothetical protein
MADFYGYHIAEEHKDKLVLGLLALNKTDIKDSLSDVTSIVFCLHLLDTGFN